MRIDLPVSIFGSWQPDLYHSSWKACPKFLKSPKSTIDCTSLTNSRKLGLFQSSSGKSGTRGVDYRLDSWEIQSSPLGVLHQMFAPRFGQNNSSKLSHSPSRPFISQFSMVRSSFSVEHARVDLPVQPLKSKTLDLRQSSWKACPNLHELSGVLLVQLFSTSSFLLRV